jgi:RHS repeat-associated protein
MSPGIVAESDLSGNLTSEYVFFDGERVARRDGPNGSGGVFYYFSDHLKTTDIVTNAQGTILNESDFYPWGGELQFANGDSNHYKFTGKERDSETGLDYFGARYYSNGLGRFISADWSSAPIGSLLIQAGVSPAYVQKQMGHKSISGDDRCLRPSNSGRKCGMDRRPGQKTSGRIRTQHAHARGGAKRGVGEERGSY